MPFLSPSGNSPPGCTLPTALGDTRVISYSYDPLYRLTSAAYSSGECYQYAYDKVGNRTAMTTTVGTTTYLYDNANRLSSAGGASYTWDNNGNLINDGSALYRYDRANRLISTTLNSTTSLFNYNGDGVRLKQTVAGVVTTYTQDVAAPLPVVLQSRTGVTTTKYLYSVGTRPLAQNSTTWEYLLPDALGSVRQITNASGYIVLTKDYEPYGSVLNSSGSAASTYGFTGEERDQSGLIFLRARYMQPKLGIFTSHDPWSGDVMRPGSMNGYSYVESDPVNRVDPSGQIARLPCWWPNHEEKVYEWSEGRRVLVGVRCVGPSGLPPMFGSTTTMSTGNPASDVVRILVIYGVYCASQLAQEIETQTKTWTWQDIYALPVAEPFRAPLPTPVPLKDPFPLPLPRPTLQPTPTREPDYIWRGIDSPAAKPRDFKPRFPRDVDGLSFFEGRANMWGATLMVPNPEDRKLFRAGFTYSALTFAGFSVEPDNVPPGHRSIKRSNNQEWQEWLYANDPQHSYQQTLASMAVIVEPNTAP